MKVRSGIDRGQTIVDRTDLTHFTVLLEGVACFSTQHEDGGRQIYAFHHPGDFLGLHSFLFPPSAELIEVQALTSCTIGTMAAPGRRPSIAASTTPRSSGRDAVASRPGSSRD